jgi:hypothetical protein
MTNLDAEAMALLSQMRPALAQARAVPTAAGLLATALALFALALIGPAAARTRVPLPQPRPAIETPDEPEPMQDNDRSPPQERGAGGKPAAAAAPPAPSACRQALTADIAIAPSLPPIKGPGGCGGDDLVKLEAVVLPDGGHVALKPAATLRCPMATAVADWVRTDVAALASALNTRPSEVDNFDSFECRGRNRIPGAQLSEHGKANALDVRSLKFANGRVLGLTDRTADRGLRERVLHSVCSRFSTVLGPDSDWYHEDHIHLDLAERRNDYRICHWDVLDPMPAVAPLLPQPRPEDAPSSEAHDDGGKQVPAAVAAPDTAAPAADDQAEAPAEDKAEAPPPKPKSSPRKSKAHRTRAPLSLTPRKSM